MRINQPLHGGARAAAAVRRHAIVIVLAVAVLATGVPPLLTWQRSQTQRERSMSNLRRLANAFLLYTQDWDGRAVCPAQKTRAGAWILWPDLLKGYVLDESSFSDPANPVETDAPARQPVFGYTVPTSYALNRRVWGVFSPGPFPIENLELPAQTALFLEAGPMWREPRRFSPVDRAPQPAVLGYGDTTDRWRELFEYPSPHRGEMAVVAVDGHARAVRVAHYTSADGPHDEVYGRVGDGIFDWNGGHPNGETDRPQRE